MLNCELLGPSVRAPPYQEGARLDREEENQELQMGLMSALSVPRLMNYDKFGQNEQNVIAEVIKIVDLVDSFVPAGTVCRESFGHCDVDEFCSGRNSFCPENVYLKDGKPCGQGSFCNQGVCSNVDRQCEELWGPGVGSAAENCYKATNVEGTKYGHCGRNANRELTKCEPEQVVCGRIQCLTDRPVSVMGGRVEGGIFLPGCRKLYPSYDDAYSDYLIHDGTKCSDKLVCYRQRCEDPSVFKVEECDATCNNHGVWN
ncbi:disintegrin and metalloproteinase domain-containing protein 19-like [Cetorhinus maximus]